MTIATITIGTFDVELFTRRVIADAVLAASVSYWRSRADTFEAAAPRPGDYTGRATADDLAARGADLRATALACRQKAALIEAGWLDGIEDAELDDAFGEAA